MTRTGRTADAETRQLAVVLYVQEGDCAGRRGPLDLGELEEPGHYGDVYQVLCRLIRDVGAQRVADELMIGWKMYSRRDRGMNA